MIVIEEDKLRLPCQEVGEEEVAELRQKLEKELQRSARRGRPGIGLALPQIGIQKQMAIVRIKTNGGKDLNLDLVNPKILEKYDPITFEEGCLSFPGKTVKTARFNEIRVSTDVAPYLVVATGLVAVCIQHEVDHLHGVLMMDRAVSSKT